MADLRFAGVRGLHQRVSLTAFSRSLPAAGKRTLCLGESLGRLRSVESEERTNKSPLSCWPADSLVRLLSIVVVNTSHGLGHVDSNNGDANDIVCVYLLHRRMHIVTGKAGTTRGDVYG